MKRTDTIHRGWFVGTFVVLLTIVCVLFWYGEMYECQKFAQQEGITTQYSLTCRLSYKDRLFTRLEYHAEKRKERDEQRVKEQKEWELEVFKHTLKSMRKDFEFYYDLYKEESDSLNKDPLPIHGWKL